MSVSEILKNIREKNNLTQDQMAERVGAPRQLFCQCCGMPLGDDAIISREIDGNLNEDYCKWCYADDKFTYTNKDTLLDFMLSHMPNPENLPEAERRKFFDSHLSQLKHWKT